MPKGLVVGTANGSVAEVVDHLTAELEARGIEVFATIDLHGLLMQLFTKLAAADVTE